MASAAEKIEARYPGSKAIVYPLGNGRKFIAQLVFADGSKCDGHIAPSRAAALKRLDDELRDEARVKADREAHRSGRGNPAPRAKWVPFLHNRDDGGANVTSADDDFAFGHNAPAADDFSAWLERTNPASALIELGKLTGLDDARSKRRWALADAPWLCVDDRGRLFIVYVGRVVAPSSEADRKKYSRLHWGNAGDGDLRDGKIAPPPFALGPSGTVIRYTTRKGVDRELVDYVHEWGEGGPRKFVAPRIATHSCARCAPSCKAKGALSLVGGTYTVNDRGIVG